MFNVKLKQNKQNAIQAEKGKNLAFYYKFLILKCPLLSKIK